MTVLPGSQPPEVCVLPLGFPVTSPVTFNKVSNLSGVFSFPHYNKNNSPRHFPASQGVVGIHESLVKSFPHSPSENAGM